MTDPAAHTPDVDTLVEKIAKELPSPSWAHAALADLAATARDPGEEWVRRSALVVTTRRAEAAEADRDKALRVEESLKAMLASAGNDRDRLRDERDEAQADRNEYVDIAERLDGERDRLARRVAELEAALRDLRETAEPRKWETPGHPMNEWTKREPILRKIEAALAGDGGGA